MRKIIPLILIVVFSKYSAAQKEMKIYYDDSKKHLKAVGFVNDAGKLTGSCKRYNEQGVLIEEANYINGVPNGLVIDYVVTAKNEHVIHNKQTYKNGVLDGYSLLNCFVNGVYKGKESEGQIKNGVMVGLWKEWYCQDTDTGGQRVPNLLKEVGTYSSDGKGKDGLWTSYFQNGKLDFIGYYSNRIQTGGFGEQTGSWRYYSYKTGNLISKGSYSEGQKSGPWYYYDPNDSTKVLNSGEYVKDKRVGPWTIYFDKKWNETEVPSEFAFYRKVTFDNSGKPTADKVQDFYISGAKQWEGSLLSMNPDVFNKNGVLIYYYENGKVEQEWDFDKGIFKDYYESGTVKDEKGILKDGTIEGKYKSYYENGNLSTEGAYKNGKVEQEWNFDKGILKDYYESGKLKDEFGILKDGTIEGKYKSYYENGNLLTEGGYKNKKADGYWKYYYQNGQVKGDVTYKDGNVIIPYKE